MSRAKHKGRVRRPGQPALQKQRPHKDTENVGYSVSEQDHHTFLQFTKSLSSIAMPPELAVRMAVKLIRSAMRAGFPQQSVTVTLEEMEPQHVAARSENRTDRMQAAESQLPN